MTTPKPIAALVIGSFCWNSAFAAVPHRTPANVPVTISAEEILNNSSDLRGEITRGLQDQRIITELNKMGVDKKEVERRLAAMSDNELQQLQKTAQRTAGGDVVIISVTTLLLGLIVLILLLK